MSKIRLPAFHRYIFRGMGLLLICLMSLGCQPSVTQPVSPSPAMTFTPKNTIMPTSILTPTMTFPHRWPIPPLTKDQINAVKSCNMKSLAAQRYPDSTKSLDTVVFTPQSGCDWAVLAFVYAQRSNGRPLQPARDAFARAVSINPGFALVTPLFYEYFSSVSLADPPLFASHEITDVIIRYQWGGLGESVYYTAEIHNANSKPTFVVEPEKIAKVKRPAADKILIQQLAPALTDLLPVRTDFSVSPCYDNYPNWEVILSFSDSTSITMTAHSNFLSFGGPWFTWIDGQSYIQMSSAFPVALGSVIAQLNLPPGQPGAMVCGGSDEDDILGRAFPEYMMADYGKTLVPPTDIPEPAQTPTSLFSLTQTGQSKKMKGVFATKETETDGQYYRILHFYEDGLVFYGSILLQPKDGEESYWPDVLIWPASPDAQDACKGKYYLNGTRIEFSVTCFNRAFWWDETPTPRSVIDYTGVYNGKTLILDSYYHYSGFVASDEVFLPITDPLLKP